MNSIISYLLSELNGKISHFEKYLIKSDLAILKQTKPKLIITT